MVKTPTRLSLALILASLQASPIFAADARKSVVTLSPAIVGAPQIKITGLKLESAGAKASTPGLVGSSVQILRVAQVPQISPAAAFQGAVFNAVDAHPMAAPAIGAPVGMGVGAAALSQQIVGVQQALEQDPTGGAAGEGLDQLYFGKREKQHGRAPVSGAFGGGQKPAKNGKGQRKVDPSQSAVFIVNDEGVEINGRAAEYFTEVRRLVNKYLGRIDMSESLDVMDDTYAAVQAKLKVIEAVAQQRSIADHNTHLEKTLIWVDGTMTDSKGRKIAVNTHQVYYHHAPEGPNKAASEIAEGNRRTDAYLVEMEAYFSSGGKAERALGKLDEVVLGFDTRGYDGIKNHLKGKEAELAKRYGKKFRFVYLDEVATAPTDIEGTRSELNRLIKKYKQHGLQKIVEGVIYSRYVGLLLELKTLEHYYDRGYTILQAGHELFDANGHYVTELDTVVRSPEGKTIVVEAKSARVSLDYEKALEDKIVRKLKTYIAYRAEMEAMLGAPMDEVVFSVDVGHEVGFKDYLESQKEILSERFGLPVSFLFLESGPEQKDGEKPKKRR